MIAEQNLSIRNGEPLNKLMLTVEDVAKLLRISKRTVWRMRSANRIPSPIKIGGVIRWRAKEIELWIQQGCPDLMS